MYSLLRTQNQSENPILRKDRNNFISVQKPAEPAEHQFLSPEDRVNMPTIRGGLNGSIADILQASGYGTETDFRTDEEMMGKYVIKIWNFLC